MATGAGSGVTLGMPHSPSRREFLVLGAAGATAWVSGPARAQAPAPAPGALKAAVIGHTGRGDYGHGMELAFAGDPGIEVVGVADPDATGRAAAMKRAGAARGYADYRELLEREKPSLVSLAMRQADQHHEIGLACLRAGAHVYCEKPFARSPEECDALLAEAARRGLRVAVAHTMRVTAPVLGLRRALRDGLIGELAEMRAYGKQDARAGGEDMMVLGSHLFDLFRLFAGDPAWVTARVLARGRGITVADRRQVKDNVGWVAGDQIFAQFGFGGGVHATFTSDARLRETAGHWGIEFHGSKGVARLNGDIAPNAFVRAGGKWSPGGRDDGWKPLDGKWLRESGEPAGGLPGDWLAAVRQGREAACSGRDGAWAVEMVAGVYRAALGGDRRVFPLPERAHPLG